MFDINACRIHIDYLIIRFITRILVEKKINNDFFSNVNILGFADQFGQNYCNVAASRIQQIGMVIT
jgi:hypothetical protein